MKAALNIFGNEYCEIYVSNDKDTIEIRVYTISLSSIIVGQSGKTGFSSIFVFDMKLQCTFAVHMSGPEGLSK